MGNSNGHPVVLFDGYCRLCHASVRFLRRYDQKRLFRFATLDSSFAQKLELHGVDGNSVLLYHQDKLYKRSDAVLHMLRLLGGAWRVFYLFRFIPLFVRDGAYNFIAGIRYRLFGKYENCPLPDAAHADLFLD